MVPPGSNDKLRLEIGHVLFIDIVGYSKLLNEEQKERLNKLIEIVLATTPVREATDEQLVRLPTGDGPLLCVLGLIDAALGNKATALKEGRRAIKLLPVEKDSINGSLMIQYFAITAAWTGEKGLALQQLELGLRAPVASVVVSYGSLKLLPFWDPLRGDPRFEKIVAESREN